MWARCLGQKDPLEKAIETHSTILTWRIPWTGGPRIPTVHRVTVSDTTEATQHLVHTHAHTHTFLLDSTVLMKVFTNDLPERCEQECLVSFNTTE